MHSTLNPYTIKPAKRIKHLKCKPTDKTVGLQTKRYIQFNKYAQPFELIELIEPFEQKS
jgi:hypothetical protein